MSQEIENKLQQTLAAGASRVDQGTRDELARRRRLALDDCEKPAPIKKFWIPVAGLAAALLAVLLVQPFFSSQMPDPMATDVDEVDMDILLAEEEFELYEELEFYEWLDEGGNAG